MQYLVNILIRIDKFFNGLLGGNPDETISSRLGKCNKAGNKWCKRACRVLHWFDKKHCEKSIELDE